MVKGFVNLRSTQMYILGKYIHFFFSGVHIWKKEPKIQNPQYVYCMFECEYVCLLLVIKCNLTQGQPYIWIRLYVRYLQHPLF